MIKLIEPEVVIRCKKDDERVVNEIISAAVEGYKKMLTTEVKMFKGKDIPCKVEIDKNHYLPEYNE